jgi:hypothetical protein
LNKWLATIIGSVIAAIIASLVIKHFLTTPAPVASIAGPTTVVYGHEFQLYADVGTAYRTAFWTDTFGRTVYIVGGGSYASETFVCPGMGQYTIYLSVVSNSGATAQTSHNIDCVS